MEKKEKNDLKFMELALSLALKGEGNASPNPLVGCVIVKDGKIVGKGYHKKFGEEHAEINALKDAGEKAKGATMYLTLEPCCHKGKTRACSKAIIDSGVKEAVIAIKDPNPKVNGKGIKELKKKGIKVRVLNLDEAREINESYIKFITKKKPFVILKAAVTSDGFIARKDGSSKWISNKESRKFVHELRNRVDAVLVGINTVLKDDPKLTARVKQGANPKRVVIDPELKLPLDANVLNKESKTIIFKKYNLSEKEKEEKLKEIEGVEVIGIKENSNGELSFKKILNELGKRDIASLLIEGGQKTFTYAMNAKVVDKVLVFVSPKKFKEGIPLFGQLKPGSSVLEFVSEKKFGKDLLLEFNFLPN